MCDASKALHPQVVFSFLFSLSPRRDLSAAAIPAPYDAQVVNQRVVT